MQRSLAVVWLIVLVTLLVSGSAAQDGVRLEAGDPPIASLISVSAPDENGIVTITGAPGAVFTNAQIAIRNLYTEDLAYTQAGFQGNFSATIYGPGRTPFLISPAQNIPASLRNLTGALPGGPATIVYGASPLPRTETLPITQLVVNGSADDWQSYAEAEVVSGFYGLLNAESLYFAFNTQPPQYTMLRIIFILDEVTYSLTLDPRILQTATLQQMEPDPRDLGTIPVAATQSEWVEIRIPLNFIDDTVDTAAIQRIQFLDEDSELIDSRVIELPIPAVEEINGIVYDPIPERGNPVPFFVSGPVSDGATHWTASGRLNTRLFSLGDELVMELDVTMEVPDLAESLVGLQMIGQLELQPVIGADGVQVSGGLNSLNGWSGLLTTSGLAIDNVRSDFTLGETIVAPQRIIRRGDKLIFGLQFRLTLPENLPNGYYVPSFTGFGQIGDGERFRWDDNVIFSEPGNGLSRVPITRLPLILEVGDIPDARLIWSLFYDQPSDGSRGLLAQQDRFNAALSNRVRYNSPTYILPPGVYSIEPYLPAQLPNSYETSAVPLIPLLLPGGRINAQIMLPDGSTDDLGSIPIAQNRVSTPELNEKDVFGVSSPLDMVQLTSLNSALTRYAFTQYGDYTLSISGMLEDIWENRYSGGGTYSVVIAELLDMMPSVLPGTPFEVGDRLIPALHLSPQVAADVEITVQVYPLEGTPSKTTISGQANEFGYFYSRESFAFDKPGEYIIDYEARFTAEDGTLWAASQRSAGVIAKPGTPFVLHGRRGLSEYYGPRAAWYDTGVYPYDGSDVDPRPNAPYNSGDVAWVADTPDSGLRPVMQVQDTAGIYTAWLQAVLPDYVSPLGSLGRLAVEDALPLLQVLDGPAGPYGASHLPERIINQAYAYISAVRPDVTVRQFVQGSDDDSLRVWWNGDDPLNNQIGAGANGNSPGDYTFVFGGAVIRNPDATLRDTAIYASLVVTTDDDENPRVYPPYAGEAGGAYGGPLFTVDDEPVDIFFLPTGVRPGQVLHPGDVFALAGQVGPPLNSEINVTVTSPSGKVRSFAGQANAVGYYYDPTNDFTLNEPGVWTVQLTVRHTNGTSAGDIYSTPPEGSVPGVTDREFEVYVVRKIDEPLNYSQPNQPGLSVRPGSPINFTLGLPAGWTNITAYHTVSSASYVLSDGVLQHGATTMSYQYNPAAINRDFPNIEFLGGGEGASGSDVITLTFVVTGLDENGDPAIRTRTFTLMHDRIMTQP